MKIKLLVIGSGGFLAKKFICKAANDSCLEVYSFSRRTSEEHTIKHFVGNAFDEKALEDTVLAVKPAIVVNFVGGANSSEGLAGLATLNTAVLLSLISVITKNGLTTTRIITMGSAAEYGRGEGNPFSEDDKLKPISPYGICKSAQTAIAEQFNHTSGFQISIVRPFNMVGAHTPDSLISQIILGKVFSLGESEDLFLDDPSMERDFVDATDVVSGLCALIMSDARPGIYNICSGVPVSLGKLAETFMVAAGKRGKVVTSTKSKYRSPVRRAIGDPQKMSDSTGWVTSIPLQESTVAQVKYSRLA